MTLQGVVFLQDFENGLGQFSKVIENLPEIRKTDEIFRKYYNEAYEIKPQYSIVSPLVRLSSFNTYFIFKKR